MKTPWEIGFDMFSSGQVPPIPAGNSTWSECLINAGWCAARHIDFENRVKEIGPNYEYAASTKKANA